MSEFEQPGTGPPDAETVWLLQQATENQRAGDHVGSVDLLQRVLARQPDLAVGWSSLARSLLGLGRLEEALEAIDRSVALDSSSVRAQLIRTEAMARASRLSEAVAAARQAIAAGADRGSLRLRLQALLRETGQPAQLSDFADVAPPDGPTPWVLIACMPKSGSTFLKSCLCRALKWPERQFSFGYWQNEQELSLPDLVEATGKPGVVQQHVRATVTNLQLVQAFAIRPIVLTRNIFDALVSMADFYEQGADNDFLGGATARRVGREVLFDYVVPRWASWHIAFCVSWTRAMQAGAVEGLGITYEGLMADKQGTIQALLRFLGARVADETVAQSVESVEASTDGLVTRRNIGRVGRGAEELWPRHREMVERMAQAYPNDDLSPIGL